MFNIIEKRNIFFAISIVLILAGIIAMIICGGLEQSVDFAGGTTMHINMKNTFDNQEVADLVKETIGKEPSSVQKAGDQQAEVIISMQTIDTETRNKLFEAFKTKYSLEQEDLLSVDNVEPTVGNELKFQAFLSTLIASILMLVYISFRFEFKSGVAAVIALIHDVLIMISAYAILRIPVSTSFIAAILTILGYSINDTIVIFDRIRENNKVMRKEPFADVVNTSIWQTISRSIMTSLTTLLTITALYILGVPSIKDFALPIIIGLIAGTYSSIFIASPIWVMWREAERKKKLKTA